MINIFSKRSKYSSKKVKFITEILMKQTSYPNFGLNVTLTGDKKMRKLNKTDRKKDETTDILSYRIYDFQKSGVIPRENLWMKHLGDIYISMDYLEEFCSQNNTEMSEHLSWIVNNFFIESRFHMELFIFSDMIMNWEKRKKKSFFNFNLKCNQSTKILWEL
jgi:rRNA maturation RNase YbeY